jgi:hypothetical protein
MPNCNNGIATNVMLSTPIDDNDADADANNAEMDYASQIQVQALQISADRNNLQFNGLFNQALELDSGSKPTVFRLMSTLTQFAPCSLTLTLRHIEQEMTCLQLAVHGVVHVEGLKRCQWRPMEERQQPSLDEKEHNRERLSELTLPATLSATPGRESGAEDQDSVEAPRPTFSQDHLLTLGEENQRTEVAQSNRQATGL